MNSARRGFGNADNPAILGGNGFSYDGMAFLLAGIPTTLFRAV